MFKKFQSPFALGCALSYSFFRCCTLTCVYFCVVDRRFVAEKLLNAAEIRAPLEKVRREAVPQGMGRDLSRVLEAETDPGHNR
jgi:hypothetical protein